jgi:hypothetical protein
MSKPEPAGRLQRWALKIQEYNMKIGYRPGRSHQNADCLSRIPKDLGAIPKTPTGVGVIAAVTFTPLNEQRKSNRFVHTGGSTTEISEWAKKQRADEHCQKLIERIGAEAGQQAGDQARLEADKGIGGQVKLEAELGDQVRNKAGHRDGGYSIIEADQRVGDQSSVEAGAYTGGQQETKKNSCIDKPNVEAGACAGGQPKKKRYNFK